MTMTKTRLALLFAAAASASTTAAAGDADPRPTAPFRQEHVEIQEHLGHIRDMVGSLATARPEARAGTMKNVVQFLERHIKPHAEWEERVLYPVVDRHARAEKPPFTASMRHEHKIVGRWIEELAQESKKPSPDAVAFARRADNLLGLIWAHFEEEEQVLLPILDQKMSREQFKKEIADKPGPHGSKH